jgi:acyl carrier protein
MMQPFEDIQAWLIVRFADVLQVPPEDMDPNRPFADYQLDSALAVTVSRELGEWLEQELSITLFWEYPTIAELASALSIEVPANALSAS